MWSYEGEWVVWQLALRSVAAAEAALLPWSRRSYWDGSLDWCWEGDTHGWSLEHAGYEAVMPNVQDPIIGMCSPLFWNCNPTTMVKFTPRHSFHSILVVIDVWSGLRLGLLAHLHFWTLHSYDASLPQLYDTCLLSQLVRVVLNPKTRTILPSLKITCPVLTPYRL